MGEPTNPRTVYETGGNWVVSLPKAFARSVGCEPGQRVVLEETADGFEAIKVEFRRASDV